MEDGVVTDIGYTEEVPSTGEVLHVHLYATLFAAILVGLAALLV